MDMYVCTYVCSIVLQEHREGLKELEHLERQYRSARQQQVAGMPVSCCNWPASLQSAPYTSDTAHVTIYNVIVPFYKNHMYSTCRTNDCSIDEMCHIVTYTYYADVGYCTIASHIVQSLMPYLYICTLYVFPFLCVPGQPVPTHSTAVGHEEGEAKGDGEGL